MVSDCAAQREGGFRKRRDLDRAGALLEVCKVSRFVKLKQRKGGDDGQVNGGGEVCQRLRLIANTEKKEEEKNKERSTCFWFF